MIIRTATEEDWPALKRMVGWLDKENQDHEIGRAHV